MLALKENQAELLADVSDCIALATAPDGQDRTSEKDHGRRETWRCETITDPAVIAWLVPEHAWVGLHLIARVTATRRCGEQEPTTTQRYYLSSLPADT